MNTTNYKKDFLQYLSADVTNKELPSVCQTLMSKYKCNSLYRYRALSSYTFEEIAKEQVFLAEPKNFDDITDSKYTIPDSNELECLAGAYVFTESMSAISPEMKKSHEIYRRRINEINEIADKGLRITAFTQKYNNIPMWYYYADKHRGICIEYDLKEFNKAIQSSTGKVLLPVIYPEGKRADTYRCAKYNNKCEHVMFLRNALVKHTDWSFEKEWRLISNSLPPYQYQHIPIKTIYLGLDISDVDIRIIQSIKEKYSLHFSISKMKYDGVHFKSEPLEE